MSIRKRNIIGYKVEVGQIRLEPVVVAGVDREVILKYVEDLKASLNGLVISGELAHTPEHLSSLGENPVGIVTRIVSVNDDAKTCQYSVDVTSLQSWATMMLHYRAIDMMTYDLVPFEAWEKSPGTQGKKFKWKK